MSKSNPERNPYVGRAGHLAVMGELSWRGYNTAIPQIDIGDDVFAVNDKTGRMWRFQVKTSKAKRQKKSDVYQFKVRQRAIEAAQASPLHFVFAMRVLRGWRFLIIDGSVLHNYIVTQNIGTPCDKQRYRRLDITLGHDGTAKCAGLNWTAHLENWAALPELLDKLESGGDNE
jgi:hypothetical protein